MKGIDFVDQVRRDKAGDDTEDRTEEGQELQDRCIEDDSAPGNGNGEDEDAEADHFLIDLVFRHEAVQDVHGDTLAGFAEAEENAEESSHNGEYVEYQAEDFNSAAVKTSGDDGQGRNVLGISENGLVVAECQVKGHRIREDRNEQDRESDFHSPHGFVASDVDRFVMRAVRNDHGADAGDKQDRGQGYRQHGNRVFHEVA